MKFNLNGRVHLGISLIWGGLATLFLYLVQPFFETLVGSLYAVSSTLPHIIAWAMIGVLIIDALISTLVALRIGNKLDQLEKWAEMIHGYLEVIELPTKEEILQKIEGLYERLTELGHREVKKSGAENPPPELHILSFDVLRRSIADYANELRVQREALMAGTRYLQRRMLRAFPHMKRKGNPSSLYDWKEQIDQKKNQDDNIQE
jgi:uncharacterized membrane protein